MNLSGTHKLLVRAGVVNMLDGSIHTAKNNIKTFAVSIFRKTSIHSSLVTNMHEKSHNVMIGYKSFERVEKFRCLGTNLTNQNSTLEEIKSRLKSRNLVM